MKFIFNDIKDDLNDYKLVFDDKREEKKTKNELKNISQKKKKTMMTKIIL